MEIKDYYSTLGVEEGGLNDEIQKAIQSLHANTIPTLPRIRNQTISSRNSQWRPYQTLSDQEKREAYDQLGRHSPGGDSAHSPEWDSPLLGKTAHLKALRAPNR